MITNATITSIQRPTGNSAAGRKIYADAAAISPGVRCMLSAVSAEQKLQLGATLKDASAKVRALKSEWTARGAGAGPANADKLIVTLDSGESKTYEVMLDDNWQHGGLSNYVAFLKVTA